ncbi:MAG: phosphate acyltransferase PlsX [Deltaproteobacteria bacterium]|nr:phosphate acyltransferase PlsX [Deltaproteobacteria bacterium]
MIIAVDAMGGDYAPEVVVYGALQALRELDCHIVLVGDSAAVNPYLTDEINRERITVYHCHETVNMDESPVKAYRDKKDSSIRVAFDLLKAGRADAVVSAGNSGATMISGIMASGKIEGVERPALAGIIPGEKGDVIIVDVGGNVDCRPYHLYQFGIMAEAFAVSCLGMKRPAIGLLNVGAEQGKGNDLVKAAHDLFRNSPLNFYGNIEGRDILGGKVQIIVCDGFVGNIVLKLAEGVAESIASRFVSGLPHIIRDIDNKIFIRDFKESLDYAKYGGAPVLGINGVSIVCHGHSSEKAVKNAIRMAYSYVRNKTGELLVNSLSNLG